jgi:sugar phosphate isomerase/epimerase
VAELGSFAATFGTPLFYEPLNRFETNLCNTVESGVRLIEQAGAKNVKLLCDLFHMNIEEADLAAALRLGGSHVGHIHLVDSNRRPAGLGHIDLRPIAAALFDIGYAGALSAEALPYPDSLAAARQTLATYRAFFRK